MNVFQQVSFLSFSAGLLFGRSGSQTALQKAFQVCLASELPKVGPGWRVVWGPTIWKNTPDDTTTGADNSWYIAFHPNLQFEDGSVHPTYVIAIASTPAKADYVWSKENCLTNTASNFNAWVAGGIFIRPLPVPMQDIVPGAPWIASGTANTVHLLLTTPSPEGTPSAGATLLDFIANMASSASARFISTGVSLGGALSPTLGLALVASGVTPADSTLTYPICGPSPGSIAFTDIFTGVFPARKSPGAASYQGWNLNLVNTLDIVPQVWSAFPSMSPSQNLKNITTIYNGPTIPQVKIATSVSALRSGASAVIYKPLPSQCIIGTPPPSPPTTLEAFLEIALVQHLKPYVQAIGIALPASCPLVDGVTEKTEAEKRFNYPFICSLEWEHQYPEEAEKFIDEIKQPSPEV